MSVMKELNPVVEARFEHKGYPCVVLFQPMGHRCGYVGIPEWHPYYGKRDNELRIYCHGGLTYANRRLQTQPDTDLWWIGFDCAHYGDRPDMEAIQRYYPENKHLMQYAASLSFDGDTVKTLEYVKENCIHIAELLKQIERGAVDG